MCKKICVLLVLLLVITSTPTYAFSPLPVTRDMNRLTGTKVSQQPTDLPERPVSPVIDESINTNTQQTVRVIIQLADEHHSLAQFEEHTEEFAVTVKTLRQFEHVFHGLEVELHSSDLPIVAAWPEVDYIHDNPHYYRVPEHSLLSWAKDSISYDIRPLQQIGAVEAWQQGYTGKGLKIGVLDTGVDYFHPDLINAYKGGYDVIDQDRDPYELPPARSWQTSRPGYDGTYHGTHVAGTIVGRGHNQQSEFHVKGVAPDADLYVYRVLGPDGGSAAQIIEGIERAVEDGMDVINLSLGADWDKNPHSAVSIALNNAVLSGVVVVVASGNAADQHGGRRHYTLGSPASAHLPIAVGAVNSPIERYSATVSSQLGPHTAEYELHVMAYDEWQSDFYALLGEAPWEAVYVNLGLPTDFAWTDVAGKVAIMSRGAIPLLDKIYNAQFYGASAVIIFDGDDEDGDGWADLDLSETERADYIGHYFGGDVGVIPTFDMRGIEGRQLAADVLNHPDEKLYLTFGREYPLFQFSGDELAGFSSRGPVMDKQLSIKPDVVAPGVGILSSIPAWQKYTGNQGDAYEHAYARLSGTSMAAPHVAGAALLVKQAHPDWTPLELKAALANTASPVFDPDGDPEDVYSQGAGRIDVRAAIETPAVLMSVEEVSLPNMRNRWKQVINYGSNSSFGIISPGEQKHTKQLQLRNLSAETVSYEAEAVILRSEAVDALATDADDAGLHLRLWGMTGRDWITVQPGESSDFYFTLTADERTAAGVYQGEVRLHSLDGYATLRLPFVVHVGEKIPDSHVGLQEISPANPVLHADQGGQERVKLKVRLTAEGVNYMLVEVYGYDDQFVGWLGELAVYDRQRRLKPIDPGEIVFTLDGHFVNGATRSGSREELVQKLPDGKYQLRILAVQLDEESGVVFNRYEQWTLLHVKNSDAEPPWEALRWEVQQARENFQPIIANTSVIGEKVLSLPAGLRNLKYEVTKTSDKWLIDERGYLRSLPTPSMGETEVKLTVTISSLYDRSIKTRVPVTVRLWPVSDAAHPADMDESEQPHDDGSEEIAEEPAAVDEDKSDGKGETDEKTGKTNDKTTNEMTDETTGKASDKSTDKTKEKTTDNTKENTTDNNTDVKTDETTDETTDNTTDNKLDN